MTHHASHVLCCSDVFFLTVTTIGHVLVTDLGFLSPDFVHKLFMKNKCIATSNKCLTSSNKKLLETSASLLVAGAKCERSARL